MEFMMCEFFWRCISLMPVSCKFYCPHIIFGFICERINGVMVRYMLYVIVHYFIVCKMQNMDTIFVKRPYYSEFRGGQWVFVFWILLRRENGENTIYCMFIYFGKKMHIILFYCNFVFDLYRRIGAIKYWDILIFWNIKCL